MHYTSCLHQLLYKLLLFHCIRIFERNENAIHEHERKYISTIKLHQTEIDEMKASKPTVDVEEMRHRINALQIQAEKSKQLADSNIRIVKKKNKGMVLHCFTLVLYCLTHTV